MKWDEYCQMFEKINRALKEAFDGQDGMNFYIDTPNKKSEYFKTLNDINKHVNHYFGQYKVAYNDLSKTVQNPYILIDSELKNTINRFADNKFNIVIDANLESIVDGKNVKTPTTHLLYYSLDTLYSDLENKLLMGELYDPVTFSMLWAYVKYWFWLHEQHKPFTFIRLVRSLGDSIGGVKIREQDDNEMILDSILMTYTKPSRAFNEVSLFLSTIEGEKYQLSLIYHVRDKMFDLYQMEEIKNVGIYPSPLQKSSKEVLRSFYDSFMELMSNVYNVRLKQESMNTNKTTSKLIWNGNKSTLRDLFIQLRETTFINKNGESIPLLDIGKEDLAKFIIDNFNIYEGTKYSTLERDINHRPNRTKDRITIILGDNIDKE